MLSINLITFMTSLIEQLKNVFQLTKNEADIYLYGLTVSAFTAQDISRSKNIPRPTVYHVLETLIQKGLILKTVTNQRTSFCATSPDRLPSIIENEKNKIQSRAQSLEEILPALFQKNSNVSNSFVSTHYEGLAGIKLLFEEALYAKNRSWDVIAPSQNILRQVDKTYAQYIYNT